MSIAITGFWVSMVNRFSIGKMSLNYYLCSGKNPGLELSETRYSNENRTLEDIGNATDTADTASKKLDTTSLIALTSFVIHLVMFAKIFLYQRKVEKYISLKTFNPRFHGHLSLTLLSTDRVI